MNYRAVGKYLSYLILAEAVFLLFPVLVSIIYREYDVIPWLLLTIAICCIAGFVLRLTCRLKQHTLYPRESFVVAGLGWISISVLGCLPFMFTGEVPHFVDALFEMVSGFTTPGASVVADVESLSHGLLFWRSFSIWLGGIGILVFIMTIVRAQHGAGSGIHLLRAETTGPQVGKLMPKTHESVRLLYLIYLLMSGICLVFLLAGGMPVFDALCTMFATAGTGGFSIKNDSIASYAPYLQNVCTIFMLLFGVNFTLYYMLLKREWRSVLKDEELRLYVGMALGFILTISIILLVNNEGSFGYVLHNASFTVSSVMTTTGFSTVDFDLWPQMARALLLVLMIFGAMAGSTGGGFKTARTLILLKTMRAALHRLTHPRSVKTIRVNGKQIDSEVIKATYLFLCVYCCVVAVCFVLISVDGMPMETNISATLSCINNIGPGLGLVGPVRNFDGYSYFSKIVLTIVMLVGRLEIFPILLLFSPTTWKRQ